MTTPLITIAMAISIFSVWHDALGVVKYGVPQSLFQLNVSQFPLNVLNKQHLARWQDFEKNQSLEWKRCCHLEPRLLTQRSRQVHISVRSISHGAVALLVISIVHAPAGFIELDPHN